jgi:glycosyltransferase involved in cell wall biosynthesis
VHPRVSVVLPFRDAAPTFGAALDTIAAQTLPDFECLLIDNESRDRSAELAQAIAARDPRFRMLRASGTLVDALNAGISASRAPLVARMDADDLAHPRRLELQIAAFTAAPSLSIVGCLVSSFPDRGARDGMRRYVEWSNSLVTSDAIRNALFVESPLVHPSAVIARRALDAVGGYRDVGIPEDYDLWMRLILSGHHAAKVPEVLLEWRDSPSRLTRVDPRYERDRLFETKLRHLPAVVSPGTPLQVWGAGPIGRRWARELRRHGYSIRRFIDVDERKIGRARAGVPVDPPSRLDPRDGFVLAAVGSAGAREKIEAYLAARGVRPWHEHLAVA